MPIVPKNAGSARKLSLNTGSSAIAFAAVMLLARAEAVQAQVCDPEANPSGTVCTGPVTPTGATYANAGSITGGDDGIVVTSGTTLTTLTNATGGIVTGTDAGVENAGTITTLNNDGTLGSSDSDYGLQQTGGSTLTTTINEGAILGSSAAIYNSGTLADFTNSGTIGGTGSGIGVWNDYFGIITKFTNELNSSISGDTIGFYNLGQVEDLINRGSISGVVGVDVRSFLITLDNSGTITGSDYGLNSARSPENDRIGLITTVTNSGTISGGQAIRLVKSEIGTLTNTIGGKITGDDIGLFIDTSGIEFLVNEGDISGSLSGIRNQGTIGSLTNSGTITGDAITGAAAIYNSGNIWGFNNTGVISSHGVGILNTGYAQMPDFTNAISGTISGSLTGVSVGENASIAALTNMGTISGGTVDINNAGYIGTLINAQGNANGPLSYSGKLPEVYQAYITSLTQYGQLSYLDGSGADFTVN